MKKDMKKCIVSMCLLIAVIFSMTGCSGGGTPPVLTVDGTDITIGESRPFDLPEGFETSFAGNVIAIGEMPGNSWLSDLMVAEKDNVNYAYLYLYNPDRDSKSYNLANIYKVTFHMHSEEESYWAEDNILINGMDFYGMNSDEVKEQMKDYKLANETDFGSLRFEDGSYKYFFSFDEATGVVDEITVEMTIRKNY